VLDLLRDLDLGLQLRLTGRGGLCVGIGCFPQQTCPSLRPIGKRLHQEQAKKQL
jgi:hypothetical protein